MASGIRMVDGNGLALDRESLERAGEGFRRKARANNTVRAYQGDWRGYEAWCEAYGFELVPGSEEQVILWLSWAAKMGYAGVTVRRKFSALRKLYLERVGRENCTKGHRVCQVLEGILRELGLAPLRRKRALCGKDVGRMVAALGRDGAGLRDRALILVGVVSGLRRSDLVGLDWEDLKWEDQGVAVNLRRSKTDQFGTGRWIGIGRGRRKRTCPVMALEAWRKWMEGKLEGPAVGPVFVRMDRGAVGYLRMGDKAVCEIVKRSAKGIGLDPRTVGGHSLRSGLVTGLLGGGVSEAVVMEQSGHESREMVRGYYRPEDVFEVNYTRELGL